jgi:hypothetical protein
MEKRHGKMVLALITLVLFLTLALGAGVPGVAKPSTESQTTTMQTWDGLHGLLANPSGGSGSSAT